MLRVMRVRKWHSLHSMHSRWKTQDFSKIESGPNYTTAAHAFVKATLRLGLRAPVCRPQSRAHSTDSSSCKIMFLNFQTPGPLGLSHNEDKDM